MLKPAASTKSLTQLAVAEGFEPNHGGNRGFRVGIDASIWFFHAQVFKGMQADVGENPELRTLFFRCAKLMGTPLLPLFVFDGPKRPQWKRGKRVSTKKDSWLVTGMQNIINAFGYEWRYVRQPSCLASHCLRQHRRRRAKQRRNSRTSTASALLTLS